MHRVIVIILHDISSLDEVLKKDFLAKLTRIGSVKVNFGNAEPKLLEILVPRANLRPLLTFNF